MKGLLQSEQCLSILHRRLARRGGVKRISGTIYDDVRSAMTDRIKAV